MKDFKMKIPSKIILKVGGEPWAELHIHTRNIFLLTGLNLNLRD